MEVRGRSGDVGLMIEERPTRNLPNAFVTRKSRPRPVARLLRLFLHYPRWFPHSSSSRSSSQTCAPPVFSDSRSGISLSLSSAVHFFICRSLVTRTLHNNPRRAGLVSSRPSSPRDSGYVHLLWCSVFRLLLTPLSRSTLPGSSASRRQALVTHGMPGTVVSRGSVVQAKQRRARVACSG